MSRFQLPTLIFNSKTKDNTKYKEAVMDAFESIGIEQVRYNIEEYDDLYKMCDGTLTSKELKVLAPQYEALGDLLTKAELPSSVTHWDILGGVINTFVGKLIQNTDRFSVTDSGQIAENDFLRQQNENIRDILRQTIDVNVRMHFAQQGINPEDASQIQDPEQRQQFLQAIQAEKDKIVPKSEQRLAETANYKTSGVKWGNALLERDRVKLNFNKQHKDLFKEFLLTGSCAKLTKIVYDDYKSFVWDSRTLFHSKDVGKEYLNDFEYAGRVHVKTSAQVIEEYGQYIDYKKQKELIEGDSNWKTLRGLKGDKSSYRKAANSFFNSVEEEPYLGYKNMLYYKKIQDMSGAPMGNNIFSDGGVIKSRASMIPDVNNSSYSWLASYIETRFPLSDDLCQVTEVYFRAMQPVGYLTYEDEDGEVHYGEMVTEDIYKDFLKENNIKNIRSLGYREMVDSFEIDTIVWQLKPIIGWGVKITPSKTMEPIYLGVEPSDHQISGDNVMDKKLPLTGIVKKSYAKTIEPWQGLYNYAYNSIRSLMEKELGMFLILGIDSIPSEYMDSDNTGDALMNLRNVAKQTGIMPVATGYDGIVPDGGFNQTTVHNISHGNEIRSHYEIAQIAKNNLYSTIGLQPQEGLQKTQYTTAEGIKVNKDAVQTQIEHIYDSFNDFIRVDYTQHLSIAQYIQSFNMDNSLYYTNSTENIVYMKVSDPNLPFRQIGLVVNDDSGRRRQREMVKNAILQRNTMDMDAKELISLVTTDSWRELISIADEEREIRDQRAQIAHQRQMQMIEAQKNMEQEKEVEKWKREEFSKEKDRAKDKDVATITAIGRVADVNATEKGYEEVRKARDFSAKSEKDSRELDIKEKNLEMKEKDVQDRKQRVLQDKDFQEKALKLREKEIETKRYIAEINKN